MNGYVRPYEVGDIDFLALHMREDDKQEVAALGLSPLDALNLSVKHSDNRLTIIDPDGFPAALFGTVPDTEPGWALVWLLGTDAISRYPMQFLKHSKEVLPRLYPGYDCLYNYVYKNNTLHHKWLRWLGFTILREVSINGHPFLEFVRLRGEEE